MNEDGKFLLCVRMRFWWMEFLYSCLFHQKNFVYFCRSLFYRSTTWWPMMDIHYFSVLLKNLVFVWFVSRIADRFLTVEKTKGYGFFYVKQSYYFNNFGKCQYELVYAMRQKCNLSSESFVIVITRKISIFSFSSSILNLIFPLIELICAKKLFWSYQCVSNR